jgi:multiple sugar transport system substrate-binding protein
MGNQAETFRIAVRKFAPFEYAMQHFWEQYCAISGCRLKLEMVVLDLHDLYQQTIAQKGLAQGHFDLAHINTDWIEEGYLENQFEILNPYIQEARPENYPEGWTDSLLHAQCFDTNIVGLPFHDGPECLIYRKDLFEDMGEKEKYFAKYGKALEIPRSWDEFHQVATFFQRPAQNLYGSIFACYPDGHNTVFDFCLQLWTRGGRLTDTDGNIKINTAAAIEGLDFYRKMVNDKEAVHPDSASFDSVAAGNAFAQGEAAMMINWFGFAAMCEVEQSSKVKGKVNVDLLPSAAGYSSASLNVYWVYTLAKGSSHKDIAYDFLRFVTRPEQDKALTMSGGIGCRLSTWNDVEINQCIPFYHKLGRLHEVAYSMPRKRNWVAIARVIDQVVLAAINTAEPSATLLDKAQNQIDER